MKKVEILMIGPGDTTNITGGVTIVIRALVKELKNNFFINNIVTMRPVDFCKRLYIYMSSIFLILKSLFNKNKKIAHIHMSIKTSFFRKAILVIILKLVNIPIIIHLHSGQFHIFYEEQIPPVMQKFVKFIFNLADKVILLTNSWQIWYISTIGLNNSVVIYNGVECYYDDNSKLIKERDNLVLFLGKIGKNKGIYDLIHAMKKVVKIIPDVKLIIGGTGEVKKAKQLVAELRLEKNIEFRGWIDYTNKQKLLNQSKIYILPSYSEGLPMGVLEAMGAGIGIITTSVGGIPEAIENNKNGILVKEGSDKEIADAITFLLSNNDTNTAFGIAAKKTYHEKFEIKKVAFQIKKVYNELSKK